MLNKIVLMGRLTADVEVKETDSGKRVTNFTLAVERDYTNKDGDRRTDFISCTAWEGKADFLREWFGKGDSVIVNGSLYVSHYEKDGEKRSYPYVAVNEVYFSGERKNSPNITQSAVTPPSSVVIEEITDFDFAEVPF